MATTPAAGGSLVARPEEVVEAARSAGVPIKLFSDLGSVRTVVEAAKEMDRPEDQVGVTVLVTIQGEPHLVVVPGDRRADGGRIARAKGVRLAEVALATRQEAREIIGHPTGMIPIFAHERRTPLLIDKHLLEHETVVLPSGRPDALVEIAADALARLDQVEVGEWSVPKDDS